MRMSKEKMEKIVALAGEIAIVAPWEKNKWSRAARIDWRLITLLRVAFEEAGFDWRAARRAYLAEVERRGRVVIEQTYPSLKQVHHDQETV